MNVVPAFCPHCGADIRLDAPISLNDFSMYGDGYPLCYQGTPLPLTPSQNSICWTLLKAYPLIVRTDAIILRVGSESESNAIEVQLSRIRSKLRRLGIPNPIETVWGRGYRWSLVPTAVIGHGGGRPKKCASS